MSTHTPEDPSSSSIVPYDEGDPQLCFQQETRRDAPPIINISGHARVQLGDQHTYTSSQNAVQQLITSLHYPEIVQRYETIEENHGTTCHWILHPPAFQEVQWDFFVEWLQSDQSLYWISGKPGSGKSTLMKYLVEHVSELDIYQDQQPIILSCWFWEAGSHFSITCWVLSDLSYGSYCIVPWPKILQNLFAPLKHLQLLPGLSLG